MLSQSLPADAKSGVQFIISGEWRGTSDEKRKSLSGWLLNEVSALSLSTKSSRVTAEMKRVEEAVRCDYTPAVCDHKGGTACKLQPETNRISCFCEWSKELFNTIFSVKPQLVCAGRAEQPNWLIISLTCNTILNRVVSVEPCVKYQISTTKNKKKLINHLIFVCFMEILWVLAIFYE